MTKHLVYPVLASASLLAMSTSSLAATSLQKQVRQLEKTVHAQQKMLNAQANDLKKLSRQTTTQAPQTKSTTSSSHHVSVTYSKTPFDQLPVLTRASSGTTAAILPSPALKFQAGKSTLSLSGFITTSIMNASDGKDNNTFFGSNSPTSRLTMKEITQLNPDFSVGGTFELGFNINSLSSVSQSSQTNSDLDMRVAELFIQTKIGKISLGKGSTATDNIAYSDFSGTRMLSRATLQDIGGGLLFVNKATNSTSGSPDVGDTINGLDGYSRKVRVRYDTPTVAGFSLATSAGENSSEDVAIKYGKQFGKTSVAAQIGYTSPQTITPTTGTSARGNVLNASAGFILPCGLNLTGSYANLFAQGSGRKDPHYYYVKPGYQHRFFHVGMSALSADFGRYINFAQNSDKATAIGAQVAQSFDALSLSVYAGYRHFALDRTSTSYKNMNLAILGAMFKF